MSQGERLIRVLNQNIKTKFLMIGFQTLGREQRVNSPTSSKPTAPIHA